MNIARKIELAKGAIESIARHDDVDSTVRKAALVALNDFLVDEETAIDARNAAAVAAQVNGEG